MNNTALVKLAQETISISKKQHYFLNEEKIEFRTPDSYKIYREDEIKIPIQQREGTIEIHNESTIAAIHRYKQFPVGVLNFASAKYKSGGFLCGSMAQEECLAYCSNLFIKQCAKAEEYYDFHLTNKNPLYSDLMFIDDVTFFRDENFNFIREPTTCKVLTSAAVNVNFAKQYGTSEENIHNAMKNRMRKILKCFIDAKCSVIILGAFGCGVFGNSASEIAQIWKDLLYEEKFIYHFDKICFSVLDSAKTKNYDCFVKCFQKENNIY